MGIGTVVEGIKDLARSFKEAQVALEVGKVFDTEKTIVSYDNLGIARLIYQLPTTLCEMFLREVFKKGSIECLGSGNPVHHPAILRKQPECIRNLPEALCPPEHAGLPAGENQDASPVWICGSSTTPLCSRWR